MDLSKKASIQKKKIETLEKRIQELEEENKRLSARNEVLEEREEELKDVRATFESGLKEIENLRNNYSALIDSALRVKREAETRYKEIFEK